jgi:CheW-like protein
MSRMQQNGPKTAKVRSDGAQPTAGLRQCLVTVRNGTYYALPAEIVRGLGPAESEAPTDANLPTVDLLDHFGRTPITGSPRRIVFCGAQNPEQAILVDEVIGLTDVGKDQLRPLPAQFVGPERIWFSGLFLFRETIALITNPDWLLQQPVPSIERRLPADSRPESAVSVLAAESSSPAQSPNEPSGADALSGLSLEEASDAEDTPWAEL